MNYSRIALLGILAARAAAQTLAVTGDVPTPLKLTADDLAKMPRETVTIPEQDGTKVEYEGVPLREIMKRAGAPLGKDSARQRAGELHRRESERRVSGGVYAGRDRRRFRQRKHPGGR